LNLIEFNTTLDTEISRSKVFTTTQITTEYN
jgi:hypothetical protein